MHLKTLCSQVTSCSNEPQLLLLPLNLNDENVSHHSHNTICEPWYLAPQDALRHAIARILRNLAVSSKSDCWHHLQTSVLWKKQWVKDLKTNGLAYLWFSSTVPGDLLNICSLRVVVPAQSAPIDAWQDRAKDIGHLAIAKNGCGRWLLMGFFVVCWLKGVFCGETVSLSKSHSP